MVTLQFLFFLLASSESSDLDSAELALLIKNGDHKAFKTFFENHHESLFRFLQAKGLSEQAAEDLIQKAFLIIWEKRHKIDETKSLRGYLFRIAYTRMLNYFRDHSKFVDKSEIPVVQTTRTPEDYTREKELRASIRKAINAMPEKRRQVFEFCFMQEFSYKEAAEALEVSVKTIENHMGLAFKDIRQALNEFRES